MAIEARSRRATGDLPIGVLGSIEGPPREDWWKVIGFALALATLFVAGLLIGAADRNPCPRACLAADDK